MPVTYNGYNSCTQLVNNTMSYNTRTYNKMTNNTASYKYNELQIKEIQSDNELQYNEQQCIATMSNNGLS
jgi:hypothetical protein